MHTSKEEIQLDCLSELQSAKWFLMRELQRHLQDVEAIQRDLSKLSKVELPKRVVDLVGYHFVVPLKKHQTLFEKHKPITKSEVEKFTVLQNLEEIVEGKHE